MIPAWLEYHSNIGVDYFYLFYNGKMTDEIQNIVLPYKNIATLMEWNMVSDNDYGIAQITQLWYTLCLGTKRTKWIGNFDLDEYVVLPKSNNIVNFLDKYNHKKDIMIKFKCNWAKLDKLTNEEYRNFNIEHILNKDTIVHKNIGSRKGAGKDGILHKDWWSLSEGKYIYSPDLINSNHTMLGIHSIVNVDIEDQKLVDEKDGYYLHYKDNWGWDVDKKYKKPTDYIEWAMFDYEDDEVIDNTIRNLIKGDKNV